MNLISALFFGACVFCFAGAAGMITQRRSIIVEIKGGRGLSGTEKIREILAYFKGIVLKFNDNFSKNPRYAKINRIITKLDMDNKYTHSSFMLAEELAAVCAFAVILAASGNFIFSFFAAVISFFIPSFLLNSKLQKKNREIFKELPDALDIICAFIEGGLSISRAVCRYPEKSKGFFASEIALASRKMEIGRSFQQAMEELEGRLETAEISSAIGAFIRADKSGGNVKDIIKAQADEARKKRFMEMKKRAHEAPVKLLFPLMVFIFPVIFLVLFGPIIIKLMAGF